MNVNESSEYFDLEECHKALQIVVSHRGKTTPQSTQQEIQKYNVWATLQQTLQGIEKAILDEDN